MKLEKRIEKRYDVEDTNMINEVEVGFEAGDSNHHADLVKGTAEPTTTTIDKVNDHTTIDHERNVSNTSTLSSIM